MPDPSAPSESSSASSGWAPLTSPRLLRASFCLQLYRRKPRRCAPPWPIPALTLRTKLATGGGGGPRRGRCIPLTAENWEHEETGGPRLGMACRRVLSPPLQGTRWLGCASPSRSLRLVQVTSPSLPERRPVTTHCRCGGGSRGSPRKHSTAMRLHRWYP